MLQILWINIYRELREKYSQFMQPLLSFATKTNRKIILKKTFNTVSASR